MPSCLITQSGRSNEYGLPLLVGQTYTGTADQCRGLILAGFATAIDPVFDDGSTAGLSPPVKYVGPWVNRPASATLSPGARAIFTDIGDRSEWFVDSTNTWRPRHPVDIIFDTTPFAQGAGTTSETLCKQFLLPAGLLTSARYFHVKNLWTRTGSTDTTTLRIRIGTAADLSGTAIYSSSGAMSGGNSLASEVTFFATSATQLRKLGGQSGATAWNGTVSGITYPQNTTVSDMSANPLYLTMSVQNSGAIDTFGLAHTVVTLY